MVNCIASLKLNLTYLSRSHEKDVANWEVSNAELKIMEWQKHILRGVQQTTARENAFKELGLTIALWIRDYAHKYVPTKVLLQKSFCLFIFKVYFILDFRSND